MDPELIWVVAIFWIAGKPEREVSIRPGHRVVRGSQLQSDRHQRPERTCPTILKRLEPHKGHLAGRPVTHQCPLSRSLLGVKRTWPFALHMSAYDPKRTSRLLRKGARLCAVSYSLPGRKVLGFSDEHTARV
jgi:hypothetical protein